MYYAVLHSLRVTHVIIDITKVRRRLKSNNSYNPSVIYIGHILENCYLKLVVKHIVTFKTTRDRSRFRAVHGELAQLSFRPICGINVQCVLYHTGAYILDLIGTLEFHCK